MAKVLHGDVNNEQINDQISVREDITQVYGLKGNDTLINNNHDDVLLIGGSGDDSLIMTGGNATLSGGEGKDTFEFTYSANQSISAVIEDFDPSSDSIVVNYAGNHEPQLSSVQSDNGDVVWSDSGNFNLTLKSVRDNEYFDGTTSEQAWDVLELTNAEREKESLPALTLSEGLMTDASTRADEIKNEYENKKTITHRRYPYRQPNNNDDYKDYKTVFDDKYNSFGENLEGGSRTAEEVMEYWMNHDEHKENILREKYPTEDGVKEFKKLGVGYKHLPEAPLEAYQDYWVQEFADSLKADYQDTVDVSTATLTTDTVSKFIIGNDTANTFGNDNYGVTIDALDGNDTITNAGLITSINGGNGEDTIDNSGSFVTITGGKGNDSISLSADAKENVIEYTPGDGADIITGFNATSTLKIDGKDKYTPVTDGNDLVVAVGNDSITLAGAANSGGHIIGNRSKLFIGTENADTLNNIDDDATIEARGGNDYIKNEGSHVTVKAGTGNDYISNMGDAVLFSYASGNDTISGFNETSSLKVADSSYSSVMIGKDLILIGSGATESIKILGVSDLTSINIVDANNNPVTLKNAKNVSLTEGNDTYRNIIDGATIDALGGDDTIENSGAKVSIIGGDGNDSVYSSGNNLTIISGTGNDSITNEGAKVSILSGDGDDSIYNTGDYVSIDAGAGNDQIDNNQRRGTVYIYEGGNDTIEGFNDSDNTLNIGNYAREIVTRNNDVIVNIISNTETVGSITLKDCPTDQINIYSTLSVPGSNISNDANSSLITGTTNDDTIDNSGNNVTIDGGDGNDVIQNNGGSNVSIIGGGDADSIYNVSGMNVTIDSGTGNDYVSNFTNSNNVTIYTGKGNDTINNSGDSVTIDSGTGNDSIYTSGNSVTIDAKEGDDVIVNGSASVSIDSGDGDDYINNRGDRVSIYADAGKDTVTNRGARVSILGGSDNDSIKNTSNLVTIYGGDNNDTIRNEGANVIIDGGAGNDQISITGNSNIVNGGDDNDTIENYGNFVSINGGAGSDYIYSRGARYVVINGNENNDTLDVAGQGNNINGNTGNDLIYVSGTANIVNSGDGNDTINVTSSSVVITIDSGAGNDQISLSRNAIRNIIDYRLDEGNDTIWGYDDNDSIRIFDGKGISTWPSVKSGQDVIIKVGDKKITVKDGVGKTIHTIVGESGTAGGLSDGNTKGNEQGSSRGKGDNGRDHDTTGGPSTDVDNNPNDVAGAVSSIGKDNEKSVDKGGNDISRQNYSATSTETSSTPIATPETHSYMDNAAALQVDTQPAPPEKLSLSFPTDWNFPSFNEIKMPSLIITGTPDADELHAGDEGYQLWGLESNDTLIGGAGDDVFVGGKDQGSDVFLNVSARDIVYLSDVTLGDLSRINKEGDTVTFAFKNGNSLTIQSSDTVSGAVVLGDLTLHFTHPPKV